MKWVVFALLLVNIMIFVWHYQPEESKAVPRGGEQSSRLILLNEYEKQLALNEESGEAASCYKLGPFSHRDALTFAKGALEKQGVKVVAHVSSDSVRAGYWVLLETGSGTGTAGTLIESLKKKGLGEFFLIATGEHKNSISLGVFSKPKLAKRRKDQLEKHGFRPSIRKITIPNRVYWLEWFRSAEAQPEPALIDTLRKRYPTIGQTEKKCFGAKNG